MGSSEPASSSSSFQKWATALLLIVGVQFWLVLGEGVYPSTRQRWLLLALLIASLISPLSGAICRLLDRLRQPSPRTRAIIAVAIALLSAGYFIITAQLQQRTFALKYLDEHSYAIGMQMAARFRLWMPPHPAGDFFESLQMLVQPVYASPYFPGTAMLYAPGVWLHLPYWIISALIAGAVVGLTYRIAAELLDGVAGLLSALLLLGTSIVRLTSIMLLSQMPALLMALLAIYAWLRWRSCRRLGWAVLIGAFAGWCAITRPVDAIALLLPLGIALISDLKSQIQPIRNVPIAIVLGAAPFLLLQIIFNFGVTGSWHRSPFQLSQARDYPQVTMGFHPLNPEVRPASVLPQKQQHYEKVTLPTLRRHQPRALNDWLAGVLERGLPSAVLLVLIPAGAMAWKNRRWVAAAVILPWVGLYTLYPFHLPHYIVTILPGLALCIICGIEQLRNVWPTARNTVTTFLTAAIVILSLGNMREINPGVRDEWFDFGELREIDKLLDELPTKPAVVLFRFGSASSSESEPVYNTTVAWPDDAPVVRAHDLGARNSEIFRYYAQRQPERAFYLYDRGNESLQFLGLARDLGHAD